MDRVRVVLAWLRVELPRRWRSLVVLALLIAISTGTVLTAVAGARRGDSSVDRLLAETLPADAVVQPMQPGFDWGAVRMLPQVEMLALITPGRYTINGVGDPAEVLYKLPADADVMQTVERPVVLAGRLADPTRADEAVITARYAEQSRLGVGDTVQLGLYRPETIDPAGVTQLPPAADGPVLTIRIVGVVRSFFFADELDAPGQILPSAGLLARYRPNQFSHELIEDYLGLVRLRGGAAALPAFRADLARVTGRPDISVAGPEKERHARDVVRFEAATLLAFGLAALVAAMVLVGQSIVRYAAGSVADLRLLRAVGMTPRQATLAATAGPSLAAVAGAGVGVGAAILASRWMPFGAAAPYEPHPGLDADWLVFGAGWLLVPALVGCVAAVAATIALAANVGHQAAADSSVVARAAAAAGLPVPVVVGTRLALEPGRGRSAVPVRPALLGAVSGVVGVLAAFTVAAGVADAAQHPERFGQNNSGSVYLGYAGQEFMPADAILSALDAEPYIGGLLDMRYAVGYSAESAVKTFSYAPIGDPLPIVLTDGTRPLSDDELVLGPTSARRLGASVGSSITLTGDAGSRALRVVGIGFVPEGTGETGDYGEGAWVLPGSYDALFSGFEGHGAVYAFREGVDPEAATTRLREVLDAIPGAEGAGVYPALPPQRLGEIRNVRMLPMLLGGFLALLAAGAVGHALATAVRRRRHDLAVLRVLGMSRRQCRGVVVTQATVLAVVGLLFGIPLGIALGRTVWRLVAETTPLVYRPPATALALLLVVVTALALANLLAAVPGRRAARLPVNQILRAE